MKLSKRTISVALRDLGKICVKTNDVDDKMKCVKDWMKLSRKEHHDSDTARSRKESLWKCERCSMNIVLGIVKSILDKMAKWQNEMYI